MSAVLVLSEPGDDHATTVMAALRRHHGVTAHLVDLSRFPRELALTMVWHDDGSTSTPRIAGPGAEVPLSECRVAWWRRPQPLGLHDELVDPTHRQFALLESHHALAGVWSSLAATWVNRPDRDDAASHKPYQLDAARRIGLEIPRTLVTNDPDAARTFAADLGPERTVYKAFGGTEDAWRETRVLRPGEVALLDRVRFAPLILQEYVPAAVDLRVTVMGPKVFASAIHSADAAYAVDYRADLDGVEVEAFDLPEEVIERLHELMRRLGLVYGAIDMRLTPEGRYVFLEINPAGQWRFMEARTGQPMTEAFAGLLARLSTEREPRRTAA